MRRINLFADVGDVGVEHAHDVGGRYVAVVQCNPLVQVEVATNDGPAFVPLPAGCVADLGTFSRLRVRVTNHVTADGDVSVVVSDLPVYLASLPDPAPKVTALGAQIVTAGTVGALADAHNVAPSTVRTDDLAEPAGRPLAVVPHLFDGTNFHRQRAVSETRLATNQARAGNQTWILPDNRGFRGIQVAMRVTAAGTGTLALYLMGTFDAGTDEQIVMAQITGIAGVGLRVIELAPGCTGNLGNYVRASGRAPRRMQVQVIPSDGSAWTYGAGYVLLP